jgi:predicted nucleic acid-binding protein
LVCLDTTFLIDWLRGSERAGKKYEELRSDVVEGRQQLSASMITVYELGKGARLSKNPARDLKIVRNLLSELVVLELDASTVDLSSELYSDLSRSGKLIGEFDIMIAATCIATGQALVTNDRDFDQITKLTKIHY